MSEHQRPLAARVPRPIACLRVIILALVTVASPAVGGLTPPDAMAVHAEHVVSGVVPQSRPANQFTDSLLVDPALVIGTLPNGLRYYIRANRTPAQRALLRLVVNAGSLQEDDDQQGFAHFLEHMAFNGTTHFPQQQLIDFVERSGMRFGPDLNAYTNFDETVYMLTVPTEPALLTQGLQVLEDWASGGITIDSQEVVAERGVVVGEWRSRLPDTTSQKVQKHIFSTLLGADSRYLERYPIGKPKLLQSAEPAPIRRFYEDWYRPDLMAVVAVGDFDPKQMEREIRQRFGAIPAAAAPKQRVHTTVAARAEPLVTVYKANVPPSINVVWRKPPRPVGTAGTEAAVRAELVEQILLRQVQQRLLRLREATPRPFLRANVGETQLVREAGGWLAQIVAMPDSLEHALAVVLTELERVAQHGIPEAALARQKSVLLRRLESAAASASAQPSASFASAYAQHYLTGEGSLRSAEQELALARELLPAITPEVVAEAGRVWRETEERTVMVMFPQFAHARPPSRESILALIDSVAHQVLPVEAGPKAAAPGGPLLTELPTPGRITSERQHKAAGITEWTLSNGARVLLKPTPFNADELFIRARSPGGFSLLPDSLFFSPGRLVAKIMTEAAGVGEYDRTTLEQQLAGTALSELRVSINYTEEEIALEGSPKELETLFQLLYLQFTAPMLDTAALAGWKAYGRDGLQQWSEDQLARLFARGNPRLAPLSSALIERANIQQAMAVYRDRFGNAGDFTFTVVGAFTPEELRPLVARYVASLPADQAAGPEVPKDPEIRPWNNIVRQTHRLIEQPRATSMMIFDGLFPSSPENYLVERQRLAVLADVLSVRLRTRLREELGGTYGVGVQTRTYPIPEEHYRASIQFDAAPERIDELIGVVEQTLDSLRTNGATAAELARTATMQRRYLETQLHENGYWLARIQEYDRLGIPLDRIPTPYANEPLTPEAIRQAAQRYLPRESYIHMLYLPRDSTLTGLGETTAKR